MSDKQADGTIIRLLSGFYTVHTERGDVVCQLRGRLKQTRLDETLAAVGDRVVINRLDDGTGVIEEIKVREKTLFRMAPTARGELKQVLLANLDQAVFVFACADPEPSLRMLDRFLVIAEKQHIPAIIVANKVDLVGLKSARKTFGIYCDLGYSVVFTSAKKDIQIDLLRKKLVGRISAFSGPSGVGKSSLLNRVQPDLGLAIGSVRQSSGKGKHTTVVRELFELKEGGFVADMPGLRTLSLWDTEPHELDGYFPELRDLVQHCQFNDCSHISEPGCAVRQAVEEQRVHMQRYESYIRLRMGDDA